MKTKVPRPPTPKTPAAGSEGYDAFKNAEIERRMRKDAGQPAQWKPRSSRGGFKWHKDANR